MALQQKQKSRGLNWLRPGRKEVAVVGQYVADQGPKIHLGFGGSSELSVEHVKFVNQPYQRLEQALKDYITETLRIPVVDFDNDLSDKIGKMEKAYDETGQGLWRRLWYRMGNEKEIVSAWLELIPSEYGLSVIKAGIAVVFKLAENSSEKRQKVFQTFSNLQDALVDLQPDRARFRNEPKVRNAATELYKAIVEAIEGMVLAVTAESSMWSKLAAKLKGEHVPEEARPTPDTVSRTLGTYIKSYEDAIGLARDQSQERTERYSQFGAAQTILVQNRLEQHASQVEAMGGQLTGAVSRVDANVNKVVTGIAHLEIRADEAAARQEQQLQWHQQGHAMVLRAIRGGEKGFQTVLQELDEMQRMNKTLLTTLILETEERKALKAHLATLQREVSQGTKHTAVVTLSGFCMILAQPRSAYKPDNPPNLERLFQHPSTDLRHALAEQCNFSLNNQGQVQSLLTRTEFLDWLSHPHPSLLLVDANIPKSALSRLSAISALCSTLVTSLAAAYPDAVVVHFFCGMHASPLDAWYGPGGLVRSLLIQLLMKLDARDPDMRTWNLNFIHDRDFLRNLEEHRIDDLCVALHGLLGQFPVDTHIYCVVDSISCFDARRLLKDLGAVLEQLRRIVEDRGLVPVFKVLLTNPGESTRAIKSMPLFRDNPAWLVSLSRQHLAPGEISERAVGDHLLRAPSPMRRRTPSPFRHSRAPSPAVSVKGQIARPEPVSRQAPLEYDDDGYGYDEGYWDGQDGQDGQDGRWHWR